MLGFGLGPPLCSNGNVLEEVSQRQGDEIRQPPEGVTVAEVVQEEHRQNENAQIKYKNGIPVIHKGRLD